MAQVAAEMLSNKQKAILEEMRKEIKSSVMKAGNSGQIAHQAQTLGNIMNDALLNQLELNDSWTWSGSLLKPYPTLIKTDESGSFLHQGPLPLGSKAGVVYADVSGPVLRKWLVAFHSPSDKVYVEAATTAVSSWDKIQEKLDNSINYSFSHDPNFGGRAYAEIYEGQLLAIFYNAPLPA